MIKEYGKRQRPSGKCASIDGGISVNVKKAAFGSRKRIKPRRSNPTADDKQQGYCLCASECMCVYTRVFTFARASECPNRFPF